MKGNKHNFNKNDNKKRAVVSILIAFVAAFLLGLTYFSYRHFGNFTAAQMIFHFVSDIGDTFNNYKSAIREKIIIPAFVVALLWFLGIKFIKFFKKHSLKFSFAFLIVSLIVANAKMSFYDIFSYFFVYSDIYEKEYKNPDFSKISLKKPKNLIVIYSESLEFNYSELRNNRKIDIANLKEIAKNGVVFNNGHKMLNNTGWTAAGLLSYNCGIPLSTVGSGSETYKNITCLGDVLNHFGYDQEYLLGGEATFANAKGFFEAHKIKVSDVVSMGLKKDFDLGIYDSRLYEIAKEKLNQKAKSDKPFAFYISTINMHFPGNKSPGCKAMGDRYTESIACTDKELSEFLKWIMKQDFYKNSSVVLLGDHLSQIQRYFKRNSDRRVFNLFLNSGFSGVDTHRKVNHFDMLPAILESINISVDAFGLGRNPTKNAPLLLEKYDLDELNKEISKRSKMYDSFIGHNYTK